MQTTLLNREISFVYQNSMLKFSIVQESSRELLNKTPFCPCNTDKNKSLFEAISAIQYACQALGNMLKTENPDLKEEQILYKEIYNEAIKKVINAFHVLINKCNIKDEELSDALKKFTEMFMRNKNIYSLPPFEESVKSKLLFNLFEITNHLKAHQLGLIQARDSINELLKIFQIPPELEFNNARLKAVNILNSKISDLELIREKDIDEISKRAIEDYLKALRMGLKILDENNYQKIQIFITNSIFKRYNNIVSLFKGCNQSFQTQLKLHSLIRKRSNKQKRPLFRR
ncbi:hypothetical protein EDEG_03537 [Edhazardia aedis USNM 41457]|uniref:Uncharacterized protein n=1 Tax=Edhazardia aedis (strain USNM 41457) TaxID=1003232 RepID=J9DKV3_EDHAE|nr:hypothetical protein EDEG_03537 [Edhazardia aedis USNM 41457]|eukprot:EJW02012.1 hypothetical protein EDEG_03537 [Edhazardia aedis USNM 41457]